MKAPGFEIHLSSQNIRELRYVYVRLVCLHPFSFPIVVNTVYVAFRLKNNIMKLRCKKKYIL